MSFVKIQNPYSLAIDELSKLQTCYDSIYQVQSREQEIEDSLQDVENGVILAPGQTAQRQQAIDYKNKVEEIYLLLVEEYKLNVDINRSQLFKKNPELFGTNLMDNHLKFMPSLKMVWDVVREKNIAAAKSYLNERSLEYEYKNSSDVDVNGLNVSGKYMYLIAPILILGIILYMIMLADHINGLVPTEENHTTLHQFPWMGIFRTKISNTINLFTIVILPTVSTLCVVSKSDLTDEIIIVWGICYAIALSTTSWILLKKTKKFKKIIPRV